MIALMRFYAASLMIFAIILTIQCERETNDTDTDTGFFAKIVPESVKNIFTKTNGTSDSVHELQKNNTEERIEDKQKEDNEKTKEHGKLDFFGRDIIRKVTKTATKVGRKIGFISSNSSDGLDANRTFFSGVVHKFKDHVQAIYPGTLWCGDGNKAKSYDDLGRFNDTDACCRDHDNCPDSIPADGKKYGLENTGLFTRSHCDCDTQFYQCLKTADSIISKKLGFTYFTVLGPQCFRRDFPIVSCIKTESGKCIEYEFDKTDDEKKYIQWFDTPEF